jgi:hypothetical protein
MRAADSQRSTRTVLMRAIYARRAAGGASGVQIEDESDSFFATARLWNDGIIDQRNTRDVVGIGLSAACGNGVVGTTSWGVFRH